MSKIASIQIDNFNTDKSGKQYLNFEANGTWEDLLNLLAVAMDYQQVRELFYTAVQLDMEHDKTVGRRNDLRLNVNVVSYPRTEKRNSPPTTNRRQNES